VCGIVGALSWGRPPDIALVSQITRRLAHRGPDDEGLQVLGPVVLGHRRLSIIDLRPDGHQPMVDVDGTLWITFNGEIYNYQELRRDLESVGARFRTLTDTEVILEAYKAWGEGCLERLNGMFAFALWDERQRRLLIARDRLGEKPLFFSRIGADGVVFASELPALRLYPGLSDRINPKAVSQFLSFNYILSDACIIEGIEKLPPGTAMSFEQGRAPRSWSYWDLAGAFRAKRSFRDETEAGEALNALIEDSVRLRLISDVPLGAFLSGGIDSATIVGAMARVRPDPAPRTFTIDFPQKSFGEGAAAAMSARHFRTVHASRTVDLESSEDLPKIMACAGEPFADTSIIPTYILSRFTRESVAVALSGDGGDEIFAGYETYRADRLHSVLRWVPGLAVGAARAALDLKPTRRFEKVGADYKLRRFLTGLPLTPERAHAWWRVIFSDAEKKDLLRPDVLDAALADDPFSTFAPYYGAVAGCHYLDRNMYVDIKTWLVDDILVKVDRASMAHGLEARTPFLDHRLVEFAAGLPVHWKLNGLTSKFLLRSSQKPYIPAAVLRGKKQGFGAPISHWLTGPMREAAQAHTMDGRIRDWVDRTKVERYWGDHLSGWRDHGLKLFSLACLGMWMDAERV
jgi:asparagine synthase (glutamine-hydrolysing)